MDELKYCDNCKFCDIEHYRKLLGRDECYEDGYVKKLTCTVTGVVLDFLVSRYAYTKKPDECEFYDDIKDS